MEALTVIKITALICMGIVLFGLLIVVLVCIIKGVSPSGDYPTISFNQFITLYRINLEKWRLETDYVQYSCSSYRLISQKRLLVHRL